jgi:gluconate 2-dehydrogenase alpha chain
MDFHDNEIKQAAFMTDKFVEISRAMGTRELIKHPRTKPYGVTNIRRHICAARHHGRRS